MRLDLFLIDSQSVLSHTLLGSVNGRTERDSVVVILLLVEFVREIEKSECGVGVVGIHINSLNGYPEYGRSPSYKL